VVAGIGAGPKAALPWKSRKSKERELRYKYPGGDADLGAKPGLRSEEHSPGVFETIVCRMGKLGRIRQMASPVRIGSTALLLVAGLAAGVLLAAVWPVTSPATPEWEVWVVDENGRPLQGVTVRLVWQNYSAETESHEEDRQTDKNGYAVFSARTFKASALRLVLGTIQAAEAGVHASFGPHAWVFAFGRGFQGDAVTDGYITDWTGRPSKMQSRIVARAGR
jgi:hypothetical protein